MIASPSILIRGRLALAAVLTLVAFVAPVPTVRPAVAQMNIPPFRILADGFIREDIATELTYPVALAFPPDGRIYIAEKEGYVRQWKDGVLYGRPLVDLRDIVNHDTDRGLIGMALDPRFIDNNYIYLMYAYDAPGQKKDEPGPRTGRIVRYTITGDVIDLASARVILDDYSDEKSFHTVDTLRFAPDGALFVSLGDGSYNFEANPLSYRALDVNALQGKILRIDPYTGDGLPGNPFFDPQQPHSVRSRVWAYGMRNPFRFGVHPVTGIPYVGNVGWSTYESIYRATPGSNFGWPCVEGIVSRPEYANSPWCETNTLQTVTPAELDYPHNDLNASATGGDFSFGANFPEDMRGDYFFGDYSTQDMFRATLDKDGRFRTVAKFAEGAGEIVDMQFGPDGALYYVSIYSGGVRRIVNRNRPLGRLASPAYARPPSVIEQPGDGDAVRAGDTVRLRGRTPGVADERQVWRVTVRDSADDSVGSVLLDARGSQASFVVPALTSQADSNRDSAYIDVLYGGVNPSGQVGMARIRLYPQPADGYIRSWLLTHAFPDRTIEDDMLGGETSFVASSQHPRLFPMHSANRLIDLKALLSPGTESMLISGGMAYAAVWIDAPTAREALLGMHSDESIVAILNGAEVWRKRVERPVADDIRDLDLPRITLKPGPNALVIKTHQTRKLKDTWAFKARILNLDGSVMSDVTYRTQAGPTPN